jgi:hypothetical protein
MPTHGFALEVPLGTRPPSGRCGRESGYRHGSGCRILPGGINGWTGRERVFGLCVAVDGVPRKNIEGKLR